MVWRQKSFAMREYRRVRRDVDPGTAFANRLKEVYEAGQAALKAGVSARVTLLTSPRVGYLSSKYMTADEAEGVCGVVDFYRGNKGTTRESKQKTPEWKYKNHAVMGSDGEFQKACMLESYDDKEQLPMLIETMKSFYDIKHTAQSLDVLLSTLTGEGVEGLRIEDKAFYSDGFVAVGKYGNFTVTIAENKERRR